MKASIESINKSIELKQKNGVMGYNFYEWIQQLKKDFLPEKSLLEIWKIVTSKELI